MKVVTYTWVSVSKTGAMDHAFEENSEKSLCGRLPSKQIRIPVPLPEGQKCLNCVYIENKRATEELEPEKAAEKSA